MMADLSLTPAPMQVWQAWEHRSNAQPICPHRCSQYLLHDVPFLWQTIVRNMLLLLLHCNLVCVSLHILEKRGNIMLAPLALLSLPLQLPEVSSTAAPCTPVPAFASGAQEGCNFQIRHNGTHQENVNSITPAMPRTVLAAFWDQCTALGKPAVCWGDAMDVRLVQHAGGLLCHMKVYPSSLGW